MRSFLSGLILPMSILWILILVVVVMIIRKKNKASRLFGTLSIGWLFTISTSFIPNLLVSQLENQTKVFTCEAFQDSSQRVNILVLGGGHTNDERFPATDQLSEGALSRITEGIRIHRQIPNSHLITSGAAGPEGISQAEVLAKAAILLGVDEKNIRTQTLPKNTGEEASEYKRLFGDSARLILVTSAVHIPRAMMLFRNAGLHPVPAPTNHMVKKGKRPNYWGWVPSSNNIRKMEAAVHELAGMAWEKVRR